MLSLNEFNADPRSLNRLVLPHCKALESNILPGATTIGMSVTNFKSIDLLKKQQSLKINSFFKKVDPGDRSQLQMYHSRQQEQHEKLKQEVIESKEIRKALALKSG